MIRKMINNLRIVTKINIIISILCIALLMGEMWSHKIVYDAYNEQVYLLTAQLLTSYISHLEVEVDKIDNLTLSIIGDGTIQKKLSIYNDATEIEKISIMQDLKSQLSSYKGMTDYCNILALWLPTGKSTWEYKALKDDEIDRYVEEARNAQGSLVMIPEHNHIWLVRQVRQIEKLSLKELGVLFYKIDFNDLMNDINRAYEKLGLIPEISVYKDNVCLYSSNPKEDGEYKSCEEAHWKIENDRFIVNSYSEAMKWSFNVSIPYLQIQEAIKTARSNSIIISIVIAMICMAGCSSAIHILVKHINRLLKKFNDFKRGILPHQDDSSCYKARKDEIGQLHNQFDEMALEYNRFTEQHYNDMVLLKDAQFSQLQEQIKPHFLFNALSTIVWKAYEKNDEEVAKIADALGKMLRYSFHNEQRSITMKEELEILSDYLYIQRYRYKERFTVHTAIQNEVLDVFLPPFTLQPIVENIFIHVIEETLEHCQINIKSILKPDCVELIVEDSGNCIPNDVLSLTMKNGKGNGVGLQNINNRIKLLYSEKYGLQIERSNGFSKVIIRLPRRIL